MGGRSGGPTHLGFGGSNTHHRTLSGLARSRAVRALNHQRSRFDRVVGSLGAAAYRPSVIAEAGKRLDQVVRSLGK